MHTYVSRDHQSEIIYVRETQMELQGHGIMFHQACLSIYFWTSQLGLDLISSSPWQPDRSSIFFILKEPTPFANQHSLFACWAQPMPINWILILSLTLFLHLHKEGQIENDTFNQSLYKPCLCSLQSTPQPKFVFPGSNLWHSNKCFFIFILA